MNYICVETTGLKGFVCLFSNSKKEMEYSLTEGRHSEQIILSLSPLLLQIKKIKLNFIAVDVGPGRFTGLRVGVNFAKTLAYYLKIPVYPCCSLRIMAEPFLKENAEPVLCLTEAFGQMFYTAVYQKQKNRVITVKAPQAVSLSQLMVTQPVHCVGNVYSSKKHLFSKNLRDFLKPVSEGEVTAEDFSCTVLADGSEDQLKPWPEIEPLYLRTPGVIQQSK